MSKIKSYYVEINEVRYKRHFSIRKNPNVCMKCDLAELCGSDEMGAPCSAGRDYFKKE